jgi:hypothetical protein
MTMLPFEELLSGLSKRTFGRTTLYSMVDFDTRLQSLKEDAIVLQEDLLLTPFYTIDGRYELYIYELSVIIVEKKRTYNEFIKDFTSRDRVDDVSVETYERMKHCYFELYKGEPLQKSVLTQYTKYVLNNEDIKETINDVFTRPYNKPEKGFAGFEKEGLFFAVY